MLIFGRVPRPNFWQYDTSKVKFSGNTTRLGQQDTFDKVGFPVYAIYNGRVLGINSGLAVYFMVTLHWISK